MSQTERVYHGLKADILQERLPPGTKLDEKELAALFGSSRTPVREALRRLAEERLIEVVPRGGASVRLIQFHEALDLNILRRTLEGLAGYLAASRMDEAEIYALKKSMAPFVENGLTEENVSDYMEANRVFHRIILLGSRHQQLEKVLSNVHDQLRLAGFTPLADVGRARASLQEHLAIAGAIEKGDGERAESLSRKHVTAARIHLLEHAEHEESFNYRRSM